MTSRTGDPPTPPPPLVVWTHRAERRLQTELFWLEGHHNGLPALRADLSCRLAAVFPQARSVVVLEVYLGFRPRVGEYILFVDVRDDADCGTAIVKLADDPARLEGELAAWRSCTPVCFPGNAVFMGLRPRYAGDPPRLVAIVYQDAQPHIGTDEIVWLETAALRAVRFGAPDPHTIIDSVRELFAHLGRVLYGAARVAPVETGQPPAIELNPTGPGPGAGLRRLRDSFVMWEDQARYAGPVGVRQQVSGAFPPEFVGYIDPVHYFRFLEDEMADAGEAGPFLPRRLRGPAHGDLHGRNVLVGVDENRVGTPAVFDYENMSCDNLLGWDFVKLETEFKIRALDAIAPRGRLAAFAARVGEFESRLAARTAECRESGRWPTDPDPDAAEPAFDRLETIVLGIRQQAGMHLGDRRKRFRDWLHEYYFLLGCYGVTTVRFENQNDRERAAALVSAGVAAAQYEGGRPGAAPIGGAL